MSAPDPLHRPRRPERRRRRQHPDLVRACDLGRPRGVRRRRPRLGGRAHAARARSRTASGRAPRPRWCPARATASGSTVRPASTTRSTRCTPCSTRTRAGSRRAPDGSWRGVALASLTDDGFDWAGTAEAARPARPHGRLRGARARLLEAQPRDPRAPARHLRRARPRRLARVPHGPRRHDRRAAPGARVRDRAAPGAAGAPQLLGLQHARASSRRTRRTRSAAAQAEGAHAVRREFAGMVRRLHEAGLEVVLDVVYNHTAEEGRQGPTYSFRGIDNASYYRHDAHGRYVDTTGCGNTLDFGHARAAAARARLACGTSPRSCRSTGSASTSRPRSAATTTAATPPSIRCCRAMLEDPVLGGVEAHRRAVGRRPRRLADRQLPGRLLGVERPLPRPHARLLARRPASRARDRHGRQRHRPLRHPARRLGEHLLARARPAREPQLRDRARRLHPRRPHRVRREAQPRQRRAQPRRHRRQQLVQPRRRGRHRRSRGHRGTPPHHPEPARHPAALGRRADAHRGRRVRPHPARQQQRLLPRLRADLARRGATTSAIAGILATARRLLRLRTREPGAAPGAVRSLRRARRRAPRRWTGSTPRARP